MLVKDLKTLLKQTKPGTYPELESLITDKTDDTPLNIIDRNDYVAAKLWSKRDVEDILNGILSAYSAPKKLSPILPIHQKRNDILNDAFTACASYLKQPTEEDWLAIKEIVSQSIRNVLEISQYGVKTVAICPKSKQTIAISINPLTHKVTSAEFHHIELVEGEVLEFPCVSNHDGLHFDQMCKAYPINKLPDAVNDTVYFYTCDKDFVSKDKVSLSQR